MSTRGVTLPARAVDLAGHQFGHLTVIERAGTSPARHALWRCRCDCGAETTVNGKRLRAGETRSCGCRMREGGGGKRSSVVSYSAAHRRHQRDLGRADTHRCVDCGESAAEWSYTGGDPAELRGGPQNSPYSLDVAYYVARCHSCHRRHDQTLPAAH